MELLFFSSYQYPNPFPPGSSGTGDHVLGYLGMDRECVLTLVCLTICCQSIKARLSCTLATDTLVIDQFIGEADSPGRTQHHLASRIESSTAVSSPLRCTPNTYPDSFCDRGLFLTCTCCMPFGYWQGKSPVVGISVFEGCLRFFKGSSHSELIYCPTRSIALSRDRIGSRVDQISRHIKTKIIKR
jgi:hypothetical protein